MIDAMRQALAALETCDIDYDYDENPYNTFDAEDVSEAIEALRLAIEQAERKPVKSYTGGYPQYATDAPKREWVGLTELEIAHGLEKANLPTIFSYRAAARAGINAFKEKNGG